jgi:glycerophosphoryl diester phosphodiesterase
MTGGPSVARIAHAYGNNSEALAAALASKIDVIEADVWHRKDDFYLRHERRAGLLPILYDTRVGDHRPGPLSLRFGRHFVRPDFRPFRLVHLLGAIHGRRHVMLDIKGWPDKRTAGRLAHDLVRRIDRAGAAQWVSVCGQTYEALDALRAESPPFPIRYSMERDDQWDAFMERMRADDSVRAVSMQYRLADEERLAVAADSGISVYCWTVDDSILARRLADKGVSGIISNRLDLLEGLHAG